MNDTHTVKAPEQGPAHVMTTAVEVVEIPDLYVEAKSNLEVYQFLPQITTRPKQAEAAAITVKSTSVAF